MKYFTGIGSRKTPEHILEQITNISSKLCANEWILRSGGADGADTAAEKGCNFVKGRKEIYLPWRGFNNNLSPLYDVSKEALLMASEIHPAWDYLSWGAKKLHARNVYQILGKDLKTPSSFVVCWTPDGNVIGGTATVLKIAHNHNIPIFNLAIADFYDKIVSTYL